MINQIISTTIGVFLGCWLLAASVSVIIAIANYKAGKKK